MEMLSAGSFFKLLPWRHNILQTLLLLQLLIPEASLSCHILRCNSEFVAATSDLSSAGTALSREAVRSGYCGALRSYAVCTRRMARQCRGDLAYHSAAQGIEDLLIQHRCPRAGPTAPPRPRPQDTPHGDSCLCEGQLWSQGGLAPEYLHCSVFGNLHVRTFDDNFHTCSVQGAWPLIDNNYLYVQITIIFKNCRQCIDQQLYQAKLGDVPAAFTDGSVMTGERRGQRSLTVWSKRPGRHVEIRAGHISTLLVVRQSGGSLGLSVRSPRAVLEDFQTDHDLQLCMWGCPASWRTLHPPLLHLSAAAESHCALLLPHRDVYYQACVSDLISSGDLNSSEAAVSALQDATDMIGSRGRVHLPPAAAAPHLRPRPLLLLLGMLGIRGGA